VGVKAVTDERDLRRDAMLAGQARAGDEAAFAALVEPRLDRTLRTARAILGNEADARDATQDAFISAWTNLGRLRDPDRFDAWLQRTLVNRCKDVLRARRRSRETVLDPSDRVAGDQTADALARASVLGAFDRLRVEERHILVLHHLHDLPLTDVATQLGVPVGTAKSRLYVARRALERALEAEA
jgi:RNA polymerase sigma-70 factor (ECF subfamily)